MSTSSSPCACRPGATTRPRRAGSVSRGSGRRSRRTGIPMETSGAGGAVADRLRVALVGGPMYDPLYEPFIHDVDVVVPADHPTLNRQVAELLAAGERI